MKIGFLATVFCSLIASTALAGPDTHAKVLFEETKTVQQVQDLHQSFLYEDLGALNVFPARDKNTWVLNIFERNSNPAIGGEQTFAKPLRESIEADLQSLGISKNEIERLQHRTLFDAFSFRSVLSSEASEQLMQDRQKLNELSAEDRISVNSTYEILQVNRVLEVSGKVYCSAYLTPSAQVVIEEPTKVLANVVFKSHLGASFEYLKKSVQAENASDEAIESCLAQLH